MGANPVGISASRGAAILGLSKYTTPVEIWLEIMEQKKPGFCANNGYEKPVRDDIWDNENKNFAAIRWGLALEDGICFYVGNIEDREKLHVHENGFLTCHVDGIKDNIIIENKTTNNISFRKNWGEPGSCFIPADYQIQIQHQMLVTGIKDAIVNVLVFPKSQQEFENDGWKIVNENDNIKIFNPRGKYKHGVDIVKELDEFGFFHQYVIEADEALQEIMLENYTHFWNEYIIEEKAPPIEIVKDLHWLIPSPVGEIEADEKIRSLWNEYTSIDSEIYDCEKRMTSIKNTIAKYISNKTPSESAEKNKIRLMAGARNIATYSISKNGRKTFRINKYKKEL